MNVKGVEELVKYKEAEEYNRSELERFLLTHFGESDELKECFPAVKECGDSIAMKILLRLKKNIHTLTTERDNAMNKRDEQISSICESVESMVGVQCKMADSLGDICSILRSRGNMHE